ncbi:helix-turn-helix transcriptional regulator [Virgibacillus sp. NKC19-16]|uniref:helix-turn-helix domain-containing protein n=1 Tax=Virgibacillus salidurans TaxID=2831673 RepID=UPI001F1B239A|nr:helix-turn-helix transcriptional regulator [Virgibacillus sp. NKC19-16]UJL46284.1 helix-turn-helix transcriptional regulator [Virgibacillus sp. NKC19-16]
MSNIASRLIQLREEKGLSPEELANELHFAKTIIWSYELGKKQPIPSHVSKIAEYFDVDVDYLLGEETKSSGVNLQHAKDLESYNLYVDDIKLTDEEIEEAIAYIKARRLMKNNMAI